MATVYNNLGVESIGIDETQNEVSFESEALSLLYVKVTSNSHTLGTVPAGKVWKIYGYTLSYSVDDGRDAYLQLKQGSTVIDGVSLYTTGTTEGQAVSKTVMFPAGKYYPVAEGVAVSVYASTQVGAQVSVFYVEEIA